MFVDGSRWVLILRSLVDVIVGEKEGKRRIATEDSNHATYLPDLSNYARPAEFPYHPRIRRAHNHVTIQVYFIGGVVREACT